MALDTSKQLTKVTYNGVEFPLAGGVSYRITTAELPGITINLSFANFHRGFSPLLHRLMFPTVITGLWPVDFPFEVFVSCNLTGF